MKLETLLWVGAAGAIGWHLAKRSAAASALRAGQQAVAKATEQEPKVIERVVYEYPTYGWGYPMWGGGRWGGGGHHHHHHRRRGRR